MKHIVEHESGLTLVYHLNDNFGWSFQVSGHPEGRMREAVLLSREFWPSTPTDSVQRIVDNNMELLDVCRSIVVDRS